MEFSKGCCLQHRRRKHLALLTGPQEYVAHLSRDKLFGQRPAVEKALEAAHGLFLGTRGKKPERELGIPKSLLLSGINPHSQTSLAPFSKNHICH